MTNQSMLEITARTKERSENVKDFQMSFEYQISGDILTAELTCIHWSENRSALESILRF